MCAPLKELRNMSAHDLLVYCGQEENVPVDLNAILKKVGISALPRDFSEIEKKVNSPIEILGAIVMEGDSAAIFYNKKYREDSHRCRFTVAHELAHCCLSHECLNDEVHVDFRLANKDHPENMEEEEEKAANIFAGELLIPYNKLSEVISKLLQPSVHILADIFDVSDNVMLKRLKHLELPNRIYGYNC